MACDCKDNGVWSKSDEEWLRQDEDLRLCALRLAVEHARHGSLSGVLEAATDFYNFLTGESETRSADKLGAIADILADE